ncbi:MAG: hypothetical protein RLY67_644 [Pseudomonadota bacterium]|jgi:hypothetical protein
MSASPFERFFWCARGGFERGIVLALIAATVFSVGQAAHAESPREMRDKVEAKKKAFLKRLPLTSQCTAENAGGVLVPPGETKWTSGSFEVEEKDHFVVTISTIAQLPAPDRPTCEAQAMVLVTESVERDRQLENGSLLCMKRVYQDAGRLPQLTACQLRTLLTQPSHLRCKNWDPILDPDGVFVAPNLMAVVTLPQAVMTQGRCKASDQPASR